ncbi:glycosyl hydrolase [Paraburkholderia sp. LEh10]|uniref:WD40/YVTN/BNR-like repeat-containing protein n=1 Tax=Paraburkholderia sp. LEh10 TaxID=2821353 RepID=UPI001AE4D9EE|nr:glycosyl hydrolase [Paraburkholderia sp. LEh10]MBP0593285.1 glycosyl hydrolase [Paraburkholderia sp. LEh10]
MTGIATGTSAPAGGTFVDPLDAPAQTTGFAATTQLGAIARAGSRLVAVGVRGLIVLSDDGGATWRQVPSPVGSDLVAVRFVSASLGWASGHDGVILATTDGGEHWVKQFDGRAAADLLKAHFTSRAASGDAAATRLLKETMLNYQNGPAIPILDLWFENAQTGWAVGPFGTILGTRDGGKSWASWIEKVDNDKMLHYTAASDAGGDVYLASEHGTLFKLDRLRDRFVAISTGYNGSFLGVVGSHGYVIAYGLGGSAYRSRDGGATWQRLSTGVHTSLTGACVLDDGRLLFATQDGHLIMSRDEGDTFRAVAVQRPDLITDVASVGRNRVVLTGLGGVQIVNLQ